MIKNIIYNDDCLNILNNLNLIETNSVDLIIADPPYFEIYGEFDFNIWKDVQEYILWCRMWIFECERILKSNGSFYLWGAIGYNKGFALPKLADWIENNKLFKIQNWITQRNSRGYGNTKRFMACREELLFMTKPNCSNYIFNTNYLEEKTNRKDLGSNNKERKNKNKRTSDIWTDIAEASQSSLQRFKTKSGKNFPTVKALKLCDRIISTSSNPGDLVFIPFAGSGSEIISCLKNNRNFIACEKSYEYFSDIIESRIKREILITLKNSIISTIPYIICKTY